MICEIEAALAKKVGIIVPILLGSETELRELLHDYQAVRVDSLEEIEAVAEQIIEKSIRK